MDEPVETFRRDWAIERLGPDEEWHHFATFDPGAHWTEVWGALEYWRKSHHSGTYRAVEVLTRKIRTVRSW